MDGFYPRHVRGSVVMFLKIKYFLLRTHINISLIINYNNNNLSENKTIFKIFFLL